MGPEKLGLLVMILSTQSPTRRSRRSCVSHRQAPPGRKLLPESAAPSGLLNADMQGAVRATGRSRGTEYRPAPETPLPHPAPRALSVGTEC